MNPHMRNAEYTRGSSDCDGEDRIKMFNCVFVDRPHRWLESNSKNKLESFLVIFYTRVNELD